MKNNTHNFQCLAPLYIELKTINFTLKSTPFLLTLVFKTPALETSYINLEAALVKGRLQRCNIASLQYLSAMLQTINLIETVANYINNNKFTDLETKE